MKRGTIEGLFTRTVCVISPRYRFVYLTTAKNATTALRAELTSERCGGEVLVRAHVPREVWQSYFAFAFLRDPLERFLSAYQEVSLRMERGEVEERPFAMMPDRLPRFLAFVDDLERNGPWNEHIAPQTAFVEGRRIDFWGRVETIQDDLQRIYTRLDIGQCPILPKRRSREWRAEREGFHRYVVREGDLDPSTITRIRELYRQDTELIESVRPDARRSYVQRGFEPAIAQVEPLRVDISLADGSEHSLELPTDHPALADLLAYAEPQPAPRAVSAPPVLQLPLDGGNAALTFPPRRLVGLQIQGAPREVGRQKGTKPAGRADATDPPRREASRSGARGEDPMVNADEGHLGGYVRAVPARVRGTAATPHGDDFTWYPLLWQWLIEELGVRSVLDIGCGEGHAARFFRDGGCEVLGVDGSLQARLDSVVPQHHVVHDFVDGPFVPDRCFDLVWSCEFVEHVEERFTHNFLAAFAASGKYLLMTYARPGQPGWHHVNCRKEEYWIEKLGRLGFGIDRALTAQARTLAGHGHFGDRGLVFVRRDERDDASFASGSAAAGAVPPARVDPLPVNPMEIARQDRDRLYLFLDVFVHATEPKVIAVCCPYGDDWDPGRYGIDYDAVDLVLGERRIRGRCLRHRLDSWEPCMLLEFEDAELEAAILDGDEIGFTIEAGPHSRRFTVSTRPVPPVDVAMSLVVRDENRWIRSFLEYYLHCLKARHVFVYDNGTVDREKLLSFLAPYRERGEVTYIPWDFRWRNRKDRKMIAQPAQEAHSLARFANCRWIGFFDIDEFLRLPNTTLPAFLERFRGAAVDGLSFGIRWFSYKGPLGFDEVDDPPLTYLYSRRDPYGRKKQKLFVRGGSSRFLRLHWLEEGKRELPIDDTEIFFHHYDQRPGRFEKGKDEPGEYDGYMLRFRDRLSLPQNRRPPVGEREWIAHILSAFESAERGRSRLTEEVLALDGMCGRYTRHFYNNLCGFDGCRYLEVGSFHGASTCAAIYGNEVAALCIDNWSEFRGKRHRFEAAVERFRGRSTVEVIEADCFEVDTSKLGPFDVYLYDGVHTPEGHYRALERFVPTLADCAVVVVDDWNRTQVRQGTRDAIRDLGLDVVFDKEILLAPEDTADRTRERGALTWWNGLYVMLLRRPSRPEAFTQRSHPSNATVNDRRIVDEPL